MPGEAFAAGEAAMLVLMVAGDPGARVQGSCTLFSPAGETVERIDAPVPFERRFRGSGMRCSFTTSGRVTVDLVLGASRTRTATSGGTMVVELR